MATLNSTDLHKILDKKDPGDVEKVKVIVRYVFDKTKEDMSDVPINYPKDYRQKALMDMMYLIAKQHYLNGK